nr:App1 family protein [Chryseosolibacter indicus]
MKKIPILLSFYALTNGSETLTFGQLTYTKINDLSFTDYNRRKTFRTLLRLYQTKPFSNQQIVLEFNEIQVKVKTNVYGAFYEKIPLDLKGSTLTKVIVSTGEEVKLIDGLYDKYIHHFGSDKIVVSDIDDTLLHSFIKKKLRKFRALMLTTMEKRKVVENMQHLMNKFVMQGAIPVYLSNSEQNLYPLIYRFLFHNKFPRGPLFLKQMRTLWDVVRNIKYPLQDIHKTTTLQELIQFFPEKKFILMGDNTQRDIFIYLDVAEKFYERIDCIIIRKVVNNKNETALIEQSIERLKGRDIKFYYAEDFPGEFPLPDNH